MSSDFLARYLGLHAVAAWGLKLWGGEEGGGGAIGGQTNIGGGGAF